GSFLFPLRRRPICALVDDYADRLALQTRKRRQMLGKENRAQVSDVPPTGIAWNDEPIVDERRQDLGPTGRKWPIDQFKIPRIVDALDDLFVRDMLRRQTYLEGCLIEQSPESPLLF